MYIYIIHKCIFISCICERFYTRTHAYIIQSASCILYTVYIHLCLSCSDPGPSSEWAEGFGRTRCQGTSGALYATVCWAWRRRLQFSTVFRSLLQFVLQTSYGFFYDFDIFGGFGALLVPFSPCQVTPEDEFLFLGCDGIFELNSNQAGNALGLK